MPYMKTVTLSLRVDPQLITDLEDFEKKTGIERASLLRSATRAALDAFSEAGYISFPIRLSVVDPGKVPRVTLEQKVETSAA
jgi:hypothetical protein